MNQVPMGPAVNQISYGAEPFKGADGKLLVTLVLNSGPLRVQLVMPPDVDQIERFLADLTRHVMEVAAVVRLENSGLVIPVPNMPALGSQRKM